MRKPGVSVHALLSATKPRQRRWSAGAHVLMPRSDAVSRRPCTTRFRAIMSKRSSPAPRSVGAEVDRVIQPVESRPGVSVIPFQPEAMADARVVMLYRGSTWPLRSAVSHMHDRERMPLFSED